MRLLANNKIPFGGDHWTMFEQISQNLLGEAKFKFVQKLVQFYTKEMQDDSPIENGFSEKDKILYGLKSID